MNCSLEYDTLENECECHHTHIVIIENKYSYVSRDESMYDYEFSELVAYYTSDPSNYANNLDVVIILPIEVVVVDDNVIYYNLYDEYELML